MGESSAEWTLYQKVDRGIFSVEKFIVTTAAMVMTTTVSLDILHRFVVSDQSKVAQKILSLFSLFTDASAPETISFVNSILAPIVVLVAGFFFGMALGSTLRRYRGLTTTRLQKVGMGLGTLALFAGIGWIIREVPSRWVCMGLVGAVTAVGVLHSSRTGRWARAFFFGLLGALGMWGSSLVRQDYIWSQELSLILLAWMAFFGGSMATRLNKHISVDSLAKVLPSVLAPWFRLAGLVVTGLFCVYISALAFDHVFGEFGDFHSGERRPSTGLPSWMITLPVLLSFSLMSIRFFASAWDSFGKGEDTSELEVKA